MQDFTKAKISRDAVWIKFESVLEVFCSLLCLSSIGLQSSQMKTGTEVLLIHKQTLFEKLYRFLVFFLLLVDDSKMVISIDVRDRLLESVLEALNSLLGIALLVENSAH